MANSQNVRAENLNEKEMLSLLEKVIEQIQKDIECRDVTALEELLRFVPVENLKGYLPE